MKGLPVQTAVGGVDFDCAKEFGLKKFDVVVGNPPFQSEKRTGTQPLWPLFAKKAYELLTDVGVLALIVPNKWCGHTTNVIKGNIHLFSLFKFNLKFANISECSKYFPNVGGYKDSFSYFVVDKSFSGKSKIRNMDGFVEIDISDWKYLSLRNISDQTHQILKKTQSHGDWNFYQCSNGFKNTNSKRIVISMASRLHYDKLNVYWDYNSNFPATSKSTITRKVFQNSSQKKVDSIFRSKLFRFLHFIYWNGDNFSSTFYNSLPFLDPTELWTDQKIYEHFGFTNEEISYIENTIKSEPKNKKSLGEEVFTSPDLVTELLNQTR
jgi:hypothetical protein